MKIYIDTIIFDLQKAGGISVYFYELISRLKQDADIELVLVDSGEPKENVYYSKLDVSDVKTVLYRKPFNRYRAVNYPESEQHIFISSYYRYSKNKHAANVTIVHDFTYEYFAGGLKRAVHHYQKNRALKQSQKIVCISKNTEKDLYRFCSSAINGKEVRVIYNGVSEAFGILTNEQLREIERDNACLKEIRRPFVLFVGARSGYKNWNEAAAIFKKMPEDYQMVSVGSNALSQEEAALLGDAGPRHTLIPPVGQDALVYLYNQAECLLYLSEYEGFGIPVAEAQKCGCPVVAKNKSSIPEVAGESAFYVENPDNIDINKLLQYCAQRQQVEVNFSWDKCYSELLEMIK